MGMSEIINRAEKNIRQALSDYFKYTHSDAVYDDVSDAFIERLANDSSYAKQGLRDLFSRSPAWDPDLDAIVINGTRTHDPDPHDIIYYALHVLRDGDHTHLCYEDERAVVNFFAYNDPSNEDDIYDMKYQSYHDDGLEVINRIAPGAYVPGKKLSRVFKDFCKALGVVDEAKGSNFQHWYAMFADELSSKKISFKLFVSINPAHFLTMSNPKNDSRGDTLTSCHSFNKTDYEYNNGCSGYARDETSFIVFTVDDPTNPELLNNRKTTRQIFAYQPGNGVLLQSRMYNTGGGTRGAQRESVLYRDLIQREIADLEGSVNLWNTYKSVEEKSCMVETGRGFGGYRDWTYSDFDGHISILKDHADIAQPIVVGAPGLCICCGEEISENLYCECCDHQTTCDCCGERISESETYEVHNEYGELIYVCRDCLDQHYTQCAECGEWYPDGTMRATQNGEYVCASCAERWYYECEECGSLVRENECCTAVDGNGYEITICPDCAESGRYAICDECGRYVDIDSIYVEADGIVLCQDCKVQYVNERQREEENVPQEVPA